MNSPVAVPIASSATSCWACRLAKFGATVPATLSAPKWGSYRQCLLLALIARRPCHRRFSQQLLPPDDLYTGGPVVSAARFRSDSRFRYLILTVPANERDGQKQQLPGRGRP